MRPPIALCVHRSRPVRRAVNQAVDSARMAVSRERFVEALAEHLEAQAAERRDAARRATSDGERQQLNRGSADLVEAAKHIRALDEGDNVDLANLHAWEDAQDRVAPYRWEPNEAQADASARYANDPSAGPEGLLADLYRLR